MNMEKTGQIVDRIREVLKDEKRFSDRCQAEATDGAIFILLAASVHCGESDCLEYDSDMEGLKITDSDTARGRWSTKFTKEQLAGKETLTDKQLIAMEVAHIHWNPERVFLSREAGERYGKACSYNYPSGWRIYSVPADGSLKDMLWCVDELAHVA